VKNLIDECSNELKIVLSNDCLHQTTVFRLYEFQREDFFTNDM